MVGVLVFMVTLTVMAILVFVFVCRTKQQRQIIARRLSTMYVNGGRRLSTIYVNGGRRLSNMFSSNQRFPPNPEVLNRLEDNEERKPYTSLPVIYYEKQKADDQKENNFNVTSTNNHQNSSQ
jgi:hypothetical protein